VLDLVKPARAYDRVRRGRKKPRTLRTGALSRSEERAAQNTKE
jgi:hypothetical protein